MDLLHEIEVLEKKLRTAPQSFTPSDFKHLYNLTGKYLKSRADLRPDENPCSVPAVTHAVQTAVTEYLRPCKLLNLGTGGYPFLDLPLIQKGFSIVGSDYAFSLTESAQKIAHERKVFFPQVNMDGQQLPFLTESFDACICSETIEHIPDDRRVILEIHRVLKPAGTLVLTVPNLWAAIGGMEKLLHFMKTGSLVTHVNHLREYTYFSAEKLVWDLFSIEKWFSVPFVCAEFRQMPYHAIMSALVRLPLLRFFSLSIGFVLKKR